MSKLVDRTGCRYGRLTVVSMLSELSPNRKSRCLCVCDCGNQIEVVASSLASGNTSSCGCLRKETTRDRATKHGHTKDRATTPEYRSWRSMIIRCEDPSNYSWPFYGGRGITVCPQWRHSFDTFLADLGPRPDGHSLERDNPDGNYEPSNCRWIPAREQHWNTRATRKLSAFGETLCVAQWAQRIGAKRGSLITDRIDRLKWSVERAVSTPANA